jgi:hypothetical protein
MWMQGLALILELEVLVQFFGMILGLSGGELLWHPFYFRSIFFRS